ncbi:MAG: hypothetical protein H5U18_08700 [Rhodobacteraceae bacterium]|nr:hypothetical protein [Paracoccaceae bacterium]
MTPRAGIDLTAGRLIGLRHAARNAGFASRSANRAGVLAGRRHGMGLELHDLRHFSESDDLRDLDAAFAEIGRGATYNRAATLAMTGDHALSVAYYDAVLFADRWDAEARRNRDIVAALVEPVVGEAMGHGRIERLLVEAGASVAGFDADDPTAPTVVAVAGWPGTLADAPGEYLAKRRAAEYDRRVEEGLALPPEPSPW